MTSARGVCTSLRANEEGRLSVKTEPTPFRASSARFLRRLVRPPAVAALRCGKPFAPARPGLAAASARIKRRSRLLVGLRRRRRRRAGPQAAARRQRGVVRETLDKLRRGDARQGLPDDLRRPVRQGPRRARPQRGAALRGRAAHRPGGRQNPRWRCSASRSTATRRSRACARRPAGEVPGDGRRAGSSSEDGDWRIASLSSRGADAATP